MAMSHDPLFFFKKNKVIFGGAYRSSALRQFHSTLTITKRKASKGVEPSFKALVPFSKSATGS